jgi:hypothetical protein
MRDVRALGVGGVVLATLALGACTTPTTDRGSIAAPPAASTSAALPLATDAGPPATAWQLACAEQLRAARKLAGGVDPELARAAVETDRRGDGKEQTKLYAFPPVWKCAGLHLFVERGAPGRQLRPGEDSWQRFAELFHGSTFTTMMRSSERFQATISFDGWSVSEVDALAPILTAAADGCFVEPPGPGVR